MLLQWVVVALLVAACFVYAAWSLMPAPARRALAGALLALPLPAAMAAALRKRAAAPSGCACDGCDQGTAKAAPAAAAVQPIRFHPRPPR